jgi:hypothetical protein
MQCPFLQANFCETQSSDELQTSGTQSLGSQLVAEVEPGSQQASQSASQ